MKFKKKGNILKWNKWGKNTLESSGYKGRADNGCTKTEEVNLQPVKWPFGK